MCNPSPIENRFVIPLQNSPGYGLGSSSNSISKSNSGSSVSSGMHILLFVN